MIRLAYPQPFVVNRAASRSPMHFLPEGEKLVEMAVRIGFTLLVAFALQRLLFIAAGRMEKLIVRHGHGTRHAVQRARTLGQITRNLITLVIAVSALVHVLEIMGWDVKPLIAGAGIVGVALGFGSQSLVRDVIAGVFILAENQYSVGDLIEINGQPATVEALTVRSTVLRDFNGYVHFVPNGEMKVVTNRSRDWNRMTVDIAVPATVDLDRALEVCRRALAEFNAEPVWRGRLLEPAEMWGLEAITATEATIRFAIRARPSSETQETARELRHRLYRALLQARVQATAQQPAAQPAVATMSHVTRHTGGALGAEDLRHADP